MAVAGEVLAPRHSELVPQQRLGGHDHQRLAEITKQLAAQDVEIIGRRRAIGDLHIVLGAQLQVALEPGRAVLRPLAFIAVGQEHHEAARAQPLGFAGGDELVDDRLRAVGEIAELRFPAGPVCAGRRANSHIRSQAPRIRSAGCRAPRTLAALDRVERDIFLAALLVDPNRVTLAERSAAAVLPGQADPDSPRTRLPKASASAVAQSNPSPVSNIAFFFASRIRQRLVNPEFRRGPWSGGPRADLALFRSPIAVLTLRRASTGSPACRARSSGPRTSRPCWADSLAASNSLSRKAVRCAVVSSIHSWSTTPRRPGACRRSR
jgi:hypothetical protein